MRLILFHPTGQICGTSMQYIQEVLAKQLLDRRVLSRAPCTSATANFNAGFVYVSLFDFLTVRRLLLVLILSFA